MFTVEDEKKTSGLSPRDIFRGMYRELTLDALIEGKDLADADRADIRAFLAECMDYEAFKLNLKIILPIVLRTVTIYNWRDFVTSQNLNSFLMNPWVLQMTSAATMLAKNNCFNIDYEAEFMAMLAVSFISEYNVIQVPGGVKRKSPTYWNDYMMGKYNGR